MTKMKKSKAEATKPDFLTNLKSNYGLRVQEVDNFSKHFSRTYTDIVSEFLYGLHDTIQYYIDLQKKFSSAYYPKWYDNNFMIKQSKITTESWIQAMRNTDSFYSEFLDYVRTNLRFANRNFIQLMQNVEKLYDVYEGMPPIQKNTLIHLIKEAKKYSDIYEKNQLNKKTKIEPNDSKNQVKQVISKQNSN